MRSKVLTFSCAIVLFFILAACSPAPTYKDYYVSITGSDTTGNGSQSKPWRHIQYALDHASYAGTSTVRINLAKGIYNENIVIDDDVIIIGAGVSETVSTQAGNPDLPNQSVSVIARQSQGKPISVNNAEATLQDLNVYGGNIQVSNSDFTLNHVLVNGVTGFVGVQVSHSSFSILNSWIRTQPNYYSDYGLYAIASSGFFTNSYVGNRFDHAINLEPVDTSQDFDIYNLPLSINVYITNATVEGSSIYYADGIRIQGPANVVIKNSKITRANGESAGSGGDHNRPYAAIEVAGYIVGDNKMRRVEIVGTSMSGFDVGIGVDIASLELKVEGSSIEGLTHGVETHYKAYSDTTVPIVDFGGGPLGSAGKNIFSNKPSYAYDHHTGVYQVYACYNNWMVATNSIDSSRIFDKLDSSVLGKVTWDCSGMTGQSQSSLTLIPNENASCREGANSVLFDVVEFLRSGESFTPVGRGHDGQWLMLIGPTTGEECWVYSGLVTVMLNGEPVDLGDIPNADLPFLDYPIWAGPTPTNTPRAGRDADEPGAGTHIPECSDGIDNDGDGLVDMRDGRCLSPDWDSEG